MKYKRVINDLNLQKPFCVSSPSYSRCSVYAEWKTCHPPRLGENNLFGDFEGVLKSSCRNITHPHSRSINEQYRIREAILKKNVFFQALPKLPLPPPPPNSGNLYQYFWTSKTTFQRILQNPVTMIMTMMGVIIVIINLAHLMILLLKMTK